MSIILDKNRGRKRPLNRSIKKKGQLSICQTRAGTGFIGTVNVVGRYLGPWLAGMLIDATGVVGNSFGIVGVTMLVAAVIAFTFPRLRKKEA